MTIICLQLFVSEAQHHHNKLAYEWLLDLAREMGLPGGSAFLALAGYGRHGHHHDAGFFELAGDLPVVVQFCVEQTLAEKLLTRIGEEGLKLVYAKLPAETGVTG